MRATWDQCSPWAVMAAVRETSPAVVHLTVVGEAISHQLAQFIDQHLPFRTPGFNEWIHPQKARDKNTSSGKTRCSFLATWQPQISSKSSGHWLGRRRQGYKRPKSQKRVSLRTRVRRILSSATVQRFSHWVFLAQVRSMVVVSSAGAFIKTIRVKERAGQRTKAREGGLSTRHQRMKAGDLMCSFP